MLSSTIHIIRIIAALCESWALLGDIQIQSPGDWNSEAPNKWVDMKTGEICMEISELSSDASPDLPKF